MAVKAVFKPMIRKIKVFFQEARQEFRHVNWPTRDEAIRLTSVVVALSVLLAVFLGALDYFFTLLLKIFVLKS